MPYRYAPGVPDATKTSTTRDFAEATGWTPTIPDPDNPGQTKANISRGKWMDKHVDEYVIQRVEQLRAERDARTAAETARASTRTELSGLFEP